MEYSGKLINSQQQRIKHTMLSNGDIDANHSPNSVNHQSQTVCHHPFPLTLRLLLVSALLFSALHATPWKQCANNIPFLFTETLPLFLHPFYTNVIWNDHLNHTVNDTLNDQMSKWVNDWHWFCSFLHWLHSMVQVHEKRWLYSGTTRIVRVPCPLHSPSWPKKLSTASTNIWAKSSIKFRIDIFKIASFHHFQFLFCFLFLFVFMSLSFWVHNCLNPLPAPLLDVLQSVVDRGLESPNWFWWDEQSTITTTLLSVCVFGTFVVTFCVWFSLYSGSNYTVPCNGYINVPERMRLI